MNRDKSGVLILSSLLFVAVAQCNGEERRSAEAIVSDIVRIAQGKGPGPKVSELFGREDILPIVKARLPHLGADERQGVLTETAGVGVDPKGTREWIRSKGYVGLLVEVLQSDPDRDVRSSVALDMVEVVPDEYIREYAAQIVEVGRQFSTDNITLLLGKTGSVRARELLLTDKRFMESNKESTEVALAKLGETRYTIQLVNEFENTTDNYRKYILAERLGYIGDSASVLALARQIRCSGDFSRGAVTMQVRYAVAQALQIAFPDNEVFMGLRRGGPYPPEELEKRYSNIEDWLQQYLKISWNVPRPPAVTPTIIPTFEAPKKTP